MTADPGFVHLLDLARRGDAAALEAIARTYEKDLRIAARVHLGAALRPYLDSIDLVQSVHRSLLLGLRSDKFDISSPDNLIALALTMVRRKVAQRWRRHRRQTRFNSSQSVPCELLAMQADAADDPSRVATLRDSIDHLWQAITDDERRLLDLRLQGYSNVEAARLLGQPPETVRTRLFRLRAHLSDQKIDCGWLADS